MTRFIGIGLSCLAGFVILCAHGQEPANKDADKLGKELVRLMNKIADESEALIDEKDEMKIEAGREKLKKTAAEFIERVKEFEKLPQAERDQADAKIGKDLDAATKRARQAQKTLGLPDVLPQQKDGKAPEGKGEAKEEIQDVLKRLEENSEKVEDRLNKKDTGKDTVKGQDDIIKDLKELLKQNNPNNGGGGSSGQSGGASGQSGGASGQSGGASGDPPPKGGSGQSGGSQGNKGGDGNQQAGGNSNSGEKKENKQSGGSGTAGKEPKKGEDKQAGGSGAGKDGKKDKQADGKGGGPGGKDPGKEGGGLGSNKKQKDQDKLADLHRDAWGHLPKTKRQEMETYSKERLVPNYEDLLRQYYRTIAEQSRRD